MKLNSIDIQRIGCKRELTTVKPDLDVQSYAGNGVGIVDDDEEITITVDVVAFSGEVVEVE